ncbi:MAG: hypothetical protein H7Y89_02450 [Steroidobacteraceae bacterium]|nr:hypothetical protein [Steroidobacteraceae bacterium]
MRKPALALLLLAAVAALSGCGKLDPVSAREFIDKADDAARKRFAPEICELRGKNFKLHQKFQSDDSRSPPTELELDRKMFCVEAGKFGRLRQYKLERHSLNVDLAADRKTARVSAVYTETLPYYEPDRTPATPDDFYEWQLLDVRDESVIGIESGDIVFLSTDSVVKQKLVRKGEIQLPYD